MPPMKPTRGRCKTATSAGPGERALPAAMNVSRSTPWVISSWRLHLALLFRHQHRVAVDDEIGCALHGVDLRADDVGIGLGEGFEAVGALEDQRRVRNFLGERRAGRAMHPQQRPA